MALTLTNLMWRGQVQRVVVPITQSHTVSSR